MQKFKVTREDGTSEVLSDYGRWDAINSLRAKDKQLTIISMGDNDQAAEVVNGRGDLELIYLSDNSRYFCEIINSDS
ncbi:MAG: hypothetical protein WCG61_05120 [Chlorobium sp.]